MLKLKNLLVLLVIASSFIAFQTAQDGDDVTKEELLMDVVMRSIEFNHYAPAVINDEFSANVFDMYLKRLDNGKRFFLQKDIDAIQKYRTQLDEATSEKTFEFFDEVHKIRDERIELAKGYYKEILAQPFDFDKSEEIETDEEKLAYAKDEKGLKERWRKMLKYRILTDLHTKVERQEAAKEKKDTSVKIKPIAELEKDARKKILKQFDRWAKDLDKEDRDDRISAYVNTIANVLEPHTGYFPPLEKENFNIRMSGKLEGIGAQLREEDGYVKVVRIVPGSASWRQGDLEVNDKIIKVAQGEEDPVSIVDMKMDDVLPLIRGKKGTEVRLTVKKTDGSINVVPIVRDVVVLEESYAKSAILEHKNVKKKIGLIDLRSFYADFQDPQGRRCSRDVKKEVQKLIAEGVDGIVIDLRYNGGGSLTDVVDMSGLFVEKGPMVQVKRRNGKPIPLEDRDPNVLYDGPLVIMVNSFSASASEIMAAALQDYGRAIIIGTAPSTFGKGTVQRFFNLDNVVPPRYKELGELGSMKITIQKFYRINGGSTQLRGVTPDIILPGAYSYIETGEREEDYPMAWTEIDPAFYKASNALPKMDKVKKKSKARVESSEAFQLIDEQAKWLKDRQDKSTYPLQLQAYKDMQKGYKETSAKFKKAFTEIKEFSISSLAADMPALEADTVRATSIKNWHKNLKKDPYLEEVVQIMKDWK
ncbi:MAG: tail-specific protease [Aureispira sp.]|nr:tail-specific protease [Aureispira sp.]